MIPKSVDIIDLSSDSEDDILLSRKEDNEDDIIDLCSDNEENSGFLSGTAYDLDYEDIDNYFDQPHFALDTSGQNSIEEPISLEGDDVLSSPQASFCSSPVESKSTTAVSSEQAPNQSPPVNHGSSAVMPHDSVCAIPNDKRIDNVGKLYVCDDDKRTIPLLLTNGAAAKSQHFSSTYGAPYDSAHAIPKILPSLLASGARAKYENPPQYFPGGITRSFTPQSFASSHSIFGDNRIKEESIVNSHGFQKCAANANGAPAKYEHLPQYFPSGIPRSFTPQSFASGHSTFGDNRIKEETIVNSHGFQICAANANGTSSTVSTGPRSHRIFPPPSPSGSSFNAVEIHNPLENRDLGFNEKAIYEEAVKRISEENREEDVPTGVMSVSLLKHQKIALAWMISKENSPHCSGGILADDQGLGKTISTIALIQKERAQQSRFMTIDSYHSKSVLDDNDVVGIITDDKKAMKAEPKLDDSTLLPGASSLKSDETQSMAAADILKKTRMKPSASTSRLNTRPASGTLVVCPASILKQWANELSVKVTETSKLSVLVYHGASRTRDPTELAKYDVVVTTYSTVVHEIPKENPAINDPTELCAGSKRKQPSLKSKVAGPLARVRWFRVVLDEAQTIKNYRTQVCKACCALSAERRWCLSGTPIQNKIEDLYSYFCFLKYEPYCKFGPFSYMIKDPISRDPDRGYKKLQAILRAILLRRTKETLIDGEPIIKLPPKTIQLSKIDFTEEERAFYMALEEGSRKKFKAYDAAGTIKDNYANILVLLLRLRQACDHPLLLKGGESDLIDNSSIEIAKQLPKDEVKNLLEKLEGGPVICSICSDPPEDAVVATCGHVFCYQCVHRRLTSDGNACPSILCGKNISAGSIFAPGVLKLCTLPKLESDVATSSTPEDDSIFGSNYISSKIKADSIFGSNYISSKIKAVMNIVTSIVNKSTITEVDTIPSETTPDKIILFSQWIGMLDLFELSLRSSEVPYRRLDGRMPLNERDSAVKEFTIIPEVKVMIMSLKAGNLGLNMVAACHVIMVDPWWNPYAEDQAVDRAHRIGQTRPVIVNRLTVKGTVEDRILNLQEKKRKMVQSAFGEDKSSGNATRLTVEDLRYLFMV